MYISGGGGQFGQHAWNEIYMGEAGWIPVDATAFETDFVDSGHIRISEWKSPTISYGPREMKVLDHRVRGDEETTASGAIEGGRYGAYVGEYRNAGNGNIVKVFVRDGSLAVEIPGTAVFPLEDPDGKGRWKSLIGHRIHFEFDATGEGRAGEMRLVQLVPMPRISGPDSSAAGVPGSLLPYLGKYKLFQINAEFSVFFDDGSLMIHDPTRKEDVGLRSTDDEGVWIDQYGKNKISFEMDDESGEVTRLIIHSINRFLRED
jgi:hypothetical protein